MDIKKYRDELFTSSICKSYALLIEETFRKKIENSKSIGDLKRLYEFVKAITPSFYVEIDPTREPNEASRLITDQIIICEEFFKKQFITDTVPSLNNSNNEIDQVVDETRRYLAEIIEKRGEIDKNQPITYENTIKSHDLRSYCPISSRKVKEICNKRHIQCRIIEIHPGFKESAALYNGSGFHRFNIITINNKEYIVDCSYRQFFNQRDNCFERVGVLGLSGCRAGFFMLQDKTRQEVATQILKNGYIELTPTTLKSYLDGFTMSYRNGTYYEKTKDFSFQTKYTASDYGNFLRGQDNQINHEGIDSLGFQKKFSKM